MGHRVAFIALGTATIVGVPLHRPKNQPIHGFVLLQGGHKPRVVATLVKVSATKTKLTARLDRLD